jgi:SARP family transcriptional regulator, regulator of embCAB operon
MLQFNILGAMEMVMGNRDCTPSAPKVRAVLALLLLRPNRIVTRDALFEELWGEDPPQSATTTTQTYIYQLRKLFQREGLTAEDGGDLLLTRAPGYLLHIRPEQVDSNVFLRLCGEGRELLDRGAPADAAHKLRAALSLWTGPVLADVTAGPLLESHINHLLEMRVRALELRIQADTELGRHRELVPELRGLVRVYPLNEWFHARLIDCLHHGGRRAEALQAYHQLREILNEELGLDPAPELQRLQSDVLNGSRNRALAAT